MFLAARVAPHSLQSVLIFFNMKCQMCPLTLFVILSLFREEHGASEKNLLVIVLFLSEKKFADKN